VQLEIFLKDRQLKKKAAFLSKKERLFLWLKSLCSFLFE
jgi:hypothetical protein